MDYYGFYTGQEFEAYRFLGAHPDINGTVFRTFAPNAVNISVIGDFNNWTETPMHKIYDGNFWECYIAEAKPGQRYKFRITAISGKKLDHCDPYGFFSELRPNTASIICPLDTYKFGDAAWIRRRSPQYSSPLNIYEVHLGSWRRKSDTPEGWYNYRELGELLPRYLKENGYNYVELLPVVEHPCDASWGYQGTGFFSPTARYGTPDDLRFFIDICHQNRIGVILDFAPVHFATDDYALWNYDGTSLYEYPSAAVGRSEWGSCNFMHSRGEVRSFLQSAAFYWLNEFHIDGLRMDAVNNLIYWQGDASRGENKGAIDFVKVMNAGLKERVPSCILIAEDSSSFPGVTKPVSEGGLGFDYKWDMGWMNDTLAYFQGDASSRTRDYHKLTFSMWYYFNERYLLALSHDEVVHGKATILQKMNGDYEQKFPQARAFYMYMMAHPGKKLNFMGNEIGQLREWDENRQQDWNLLEYPKHQDFLRFIKDLNHFYLRCPALWENDYQNCGFNWIDCHQEEHCLYVFERYCSDQRLVFVFNFSDKIQNDYSFEISDCRMLSLVFSTDDSIYGGTGLDVHTRWLHQSKKVILDIAPFSGLCFLTEA